MNEEAMGKIRECCQGKDEKEIVELIQASKHVGKVRNPKVLARFLLSLSEMA